MTMGCRPLLRGCWRWRPESNRVPFGTSNLQFATLPAGPATLIPSRLSRRSAPKGRG